LGGGSKVLSALQAGAITTALPFTVILLLCCISLYRGLSHELDSLLNRAPGEEVDN
jgi:BCCT family betaine/carnitine transporter